MRFFRKIRYRLFTESKVGKYLVYALGEIVLVVIGILIALAINNAQQDNIREKKEQTYLKELRNEFHVSKLKLEELMRVNQENYGGAQKLLTHTFNPDASLTEKEFSELLMRSFSNDIAFNPNNALLNEMLNTGTLKDISNTSLRMLLATWMATLEDIYGQEKELNAQRRRVMDLFGANNSIRTILEQTNGDTASMFPKKENQISNLDMLNSLEFENNVLMFYLTSLSMEDSHYDPLMKDVNTILDLIKTEIK
ncbi:MAG: DUF6090 family protein [Bacteroidota bacterium]